MSKNLKKRKKRPNIGSIERPTSNIMVKIIEDTEVLVYKGTRIVIPTEKLQFRVIQWYHHYLQHPGHTRLEETIKPVMWWPDMRHHIRAHVKQCDRCQLAKRKRHRYGHLPPREVDDVPWKTVCCDLIGPYTIKGKDGSALDFMCLTMVDPVTGWFEIVELPNADVTYVRNGDEIEKVVIDKSSAAISQLFNKTWLSRYPRCRYVTFDNGSEFKLHFVALCRTYGLEVKPTSVKNPQANAVLERIHGVFGDMMRTSELDMRDSAEPKDVDEFLTNAAWAIRSTHHTVLGTTPGAAVFGRDMLFDIPYLADWHEIGRRRQKLVDRDSKRENSKRREHDYTVGDKCTLRKDGILRKAEDKNIGPWTMTQVHCNGTVRIQRGTVSERLNIRRIDPYF